MSLGTAPALSTGLGRCGTWTSVTVFRKIAIHPPMVTPIIRGMNRGLVKLKLSRSEDSILGFDFTAIKLEAEFKQ
eukprot:7796759-Karenia_brevis.AAC.1